MKKKSKTRKKEGSFRKRTRTRNKSIYFYNGRKNSPRKRLFFRRRNQNRRNDDRIPKTKHEYLQKEGIISEFIKIKEIKPFRIGKNDRRKTKKNKPTNILDNIILSRAGAIAQVEQTKVKRELYTLWEENKENKMFETILMK